MKILMVITGLDFGGAEVQVVLLAKEMARKYDVTIVSLREPKQFVDELEEVGVEVISLGLQGVSGLLPAYIKLKRMLKEKKADVVHSHMFHANIMSRLTGASRVSTLICSAHSVFEYSRKKTFLPNVRDFIYRWTDFLCDQVTHVSEEGLERYVAAGITKRHKIKLMLNGVDTHKFSFKKSHRLKLREEQSAKEKFIWIFVARFDEMKGHLDLINAFNFLDDRDSELWLIGSGIEELKVKDLVLNLKLEDRVKFLGLCGNVDEFLSAADGFVMSSHWEGLPMVCLEAASCSLPVVCTDVGGTSKVVLNTKTGFLVEVKNPKSIADGMKKVMLQNSKELESMKILARSHVIEEYSLGAIVEDWVKMYNSFKKEV